MHIFVRAKPNLLKTINTLGSRLADLRKAKGFSQELLAEKSGLNLRTIQRIERGETEPRGDSIIRICQVLEVGPEELMVLAMPEDRGYLAALNLSALSFLIFPLLGLLLPLILWIYRKDKVLHAKEIGRKLLNFQITWSILFFLAYIFFYGRMLFQIQFAISADTIVKADWPLIIGLLLYLSNLGLIIMNAFECYHKGKVAFYPGIPFLRK